MPQDNVVLKRRRTKKNQQASQREHANPRATRHEPTAALTRAAHVFLEHVQCLSQNFGSSVGPGAATSVCEPNFRLASRTPCSARLTTLDHRIK